LWKEDLAKDNKKAANSLADPTEYENLFPEFQEALKAEQVRSIFLKFVFVCKLHSLYLLSASYKMLFHFRKV
jgi:hypothetical protein